MEVQVTLNRLQINCSGSTNFCCIVRLQFIHHRSGARQHARDAAFAHEHVVRLFGEHEFRGACERIECTFGKRAKLKFPVAIGEIGEHKKRQPVRRFFVERTEDARIVGVARITLQQRVRLFATITAEMFVQQINHRPQMAALFHIDLKEIAQVVHRRCGEAEMALLLNRCGLGVALRDNNAAQVRTMLAGHVLPRGLALVLTKAHGALFVTRIHENTPPVIRHFDVTKLRPTGRINAHCRAQVHLVLHRTFGAHVVPPVQVVRLPMLKRTLQRFVLGQVDVVRDFFAVVDARLHERFPIKTGFGERDSGCNALRREPRYTTTHIVWLA